jgi:hypothetical protein
VTGFLRNFAAFIAFTFDELMFEARKVAESRRR